MEYRAISISEPYGDSTFPIGLSGSIDTKAAGVESGAVADSCDLGMDHRFSDEVGESCGFFVGLPVQSERLDLIAESYRFSTRYFM